MASVRAQIEDAVIALLKDLETSRVVRTVRPYNGELALDTSERVLLACNGQVPAILVQTEDGTYHGVQVQRRRHRRRIDIALYLVSGSQSTREDRTRGANQIYDMEDAILARLSGVKLTLDGTAAGHLAPVSEEVVGHDPVVCAWKQMWRLTVQSELAAAPAEPVTAADGDLVVPAQDGAPAEAVVRVSNLFA